MTDIRWKLRGDDKIDITVKLVGFKDEPTTFDTPAEAEEYCAKFVDANIMRE